MSSYWDDKAIDPPKRQKRNPVPISSKILRIGYVSTLTTNPPTERVICHMCTQEVPSAQQYINIGVAMCLSCATIILADHVLMYGNPNA